ncbi:hypothetical protein ACS386_09260 [Flavobacteriaceae bacterium LMO-SS05]
MDKEKIASIVKDKDELEVYKMTENNRTFNHSELNIVKTIYYHNIQEASLLELKYAKDIINILISKNDINTDYLLKRLKKIEKQLKNL